MDRDGYITRNEAARRLGVHPNTVTYWANTGRLTFFRAEHSATRWYRPEDVAAMAERNELSEVATK